MHGQRRCSWVPGCEVGSSGVWRRTTMTQRSPCSIAIIASPIAVVAEEDSTIGPPGAGRGVGGAPIWPARFHHAPLRPKKNP